MNQAYGVQPRDEFAGVIEVTTVRRPKFERPKTAYAFEIRVVDGPDFGLALRLDPSTLSSVLVGRSSSCSFHLSDPTVASRHCSLQIAGAKLRIVDLSDSRTTKVNGALVFEASLSGGETIRIGDTALSVNRVEQRRDASRASEFGRLRGESSAMRELYPLFEAATRSLHPVLILGERGSGKRLLAEELHRLTPRPGAAEPGLFVTLPAGPDAPAGAFDPSAALFEPGGLVAQALGGTLYIGDIGALDDATQDRLAHELTRLRQEPDSKRTRVIVGSRSPVAPSLSPALARHFSGAAGLRLALPSLRAREADVVLLARQFWGELGGEGCLPDDFATHFEGHAWSGNVRELRVVVRGWIQHATGATTGGPACAPSEVIAVAARPTDPLSRVLESDLPFARARKQIVAEFERRYVARALTRADHKISRAAAASGIAHRYFQVLKSRCIP